MPRARLGAAARLLRAWQITGEWRFDPAFLTEVEVTFAARAGGGTAVTLEHRNRERLGPGAAEFARSREKGWAAILGDCAAHADSGMEMPR